MKSTHQQTWKAFQPILVGSVVGVLCAAGFFFGMLESWSNRATDRLFVDRLAEPSITIIAIDDASLTQIGRWSWSRSVHAELIKKISDAGARVIGYDVNFPEASTAQEDGALAVAVKNAGNVVLPIELTFVDNGGGSQIDEQKTLTTIESISNVARSTGHTNIPPDVDGVVRRVPLFVYTHNFSGGVPSFVAEIARLAGRESELQEVSRVNDSLEYGSRMRISFLGAPFKTFRTISAVDILRDRANLAPLKNGIVLVGSTAADLHDALLVPTSNGVLMPGVEIHASAIDTIMGRRWLVSVSTLSMMLLIIFLGVLVGMFVPYVRARWSVLVLLAIWFATLIVAFVAFDRGVIVDIVWPTLTLVFSYAAVTLERRVQSDRERHELKTAFSRYVSGSVVDSILKDPSKLKLGGERKRMSVLFSDIRGFTTISEGLTPEQLVEALNIYLTRMTDIVFQHQGVLDKYIGDAVMAFWNAPFDQPVHAELAVRTALDMRDALADMNRDRLFGGTLELHIGLGVNTGDMVVGNVGGTARFDYTVIGDNVNLGSRLEGLTKEYGVDIIVAESTAKDIAATVLCRKLDKVAVKGKKEPVMIFEAMELVENASVEQHERAKAFETALDAYFARDFVGAVAKCDAILAARPTDGPAKVLRERAIHFQENTPPADWVGTWVFTKK